MHRYNSKPREEPEAPFAWLLLVWGSCSRFFKQGWVDWTNRQATLTKNNVKMSEKCFTF